MQSEGNHRGVPADCVPGISTTPGEADDLARFRPVVHGHEGEPAPGDLPTDLEWLDGDARCEHWHAATAVQRGETDGLQWSQGNSCLIVSAVVTSGPGEDLAGPTEDAYTRLLQFNTARGYPSIWRLWNYIPAINLGHGDHERYRRFCLGRSRAFDACGIATEHLCAGTAVGTHGNRLLIHSLAAHTPAIAIENPRQVAAYRYPRQYGPRTPSFARASAVPNGDGGHALLISGTASIVGHETIHPDTMLAQLDETMRNLETLLAEAQRRLDAHQPNDFDERSLLRVYLRQRTDAPAAEERVRATWPRARIALFEADLCRADLMVEIEAVHSG